jgi:hypothetical protein
MNRTIVALWEEIRMDEAQEKSVIESDSKEKIGDALDQLDLLHRPFINHSDYGGVIRGSGYKGWPPRGMEGKTHHRASRQSSCLRSENNTYPPLSLRIAALGPQNPTNPTIARVSGISEVFVVVGF